jgi:hypothetical protein
VLVRTTLKKGVSRTALVTALFIGFALSKFVSADPITEADLLNQARIPFKDKFAKVLAGKSLAELSAENLHRLRTLKLGDKQSRTGIDYEIRHQTSLASAIKILESGQFLSLDALVRKGILQPQAKFGVSKPTVDGEIGEQDVVFLAIGGKNAKAEGATLTPTFSGLAKVADNKHKVAPAAAKSGEGATRKETDGKPSDNPEQDFLAMANTFLMMIKGREGVFTDTERTAMLNVYNEIKAIGKPAK